MFFCEKKIWQQLLHWSSRWWPSPRSWYYGVHAAKLQENFELHTVLQARESEQHRYKHFFRSARLSCNSKYLPIAIDHCLLQSHGGFQGNLTYCVGFIIWWFWGNLTFGGEKTIFFWITSAHTESGCLAGCAPCPNSQVLVDPSTCVCSKGKLLPTSFHPWILCLNSIMSTVKKSSAKASLKNQNI